MDEAFDLLEELVSGSRDAAGAWTFVRRFAAACPIPITDGRDGYDASELDAVQQAAGCAWPQVLREAYALFGRRDDLTRCQDRLLEPPQVHVDEPGEILVFRVENQHVAEWGVALAAVAELDPPVLFRTDTPGPAGRSWRPFLDRLSLACVEMILSEWMLSADTFTDNRELDSESLDALETNFPRLPLPDYPLWADPAGSPTRWFSIPGALLRDDAGQWLWVRATSAATIAAVRDFLPGEWLMNAD